MIEDAVFNSLCADADFLYAGSSYLDNTIRIFNKDTLEVVKVLAGHTGSVTALTCLDDIIISSSADAEIKKWDKGSWQCLDTYKSDQNILLDLCVDSEQQHLFTGGIGNKIEVISLGDLDFITELIGTDASIFCLHHDSNRLYSGSGEIWWGGPGSPRPPEFESAIRIWDTITWSCIATLREHVDNVNRLCLNRDLLFSISDDGSLRVFDTNTFDEVLSATADGNSIKDISCNSDSIFIALKTGSIWKISMDELLAALG